VDKYAGSGTSTPSFEQSPWFRASAEDVDWVSKVHLQGRVQKWVDHSISVTVNVPEDATEDLIEKIYRTGWEVGCKGMTVYREGSRSGVLVSDKKKDEKKETFTETAAPKRPKVLDAVVVSFMNNDERWVAVVGVYQGRPYEIFTGRAVDSFLGFTQVSKGKVIKIKENGKNRYDFQYTGQGRLQRDHRRPVAHVQQRILELRPAHLRRPAPRYAAALCGGYGGKPEPGNSLAQQLEKRHGAGAAQVYSRRHRTLAQYLPEVPNG
jgi:YD repeat-containing protein